MGIPLPEIDLVPLLGTKLSLGAVNAPGLCLASGQFDDLEELRVRLAEKDLQCRILPIRMASHSHLVDPYLDQFRATVAQYKLSPPSIPYLSCLTGTWTEAAEATDPAYWVKQLRSTVRFSDMIREVASEPSRVMLEVGPGTTLTTLIGAQRIDPRPVAIPSLRHPNDPRADFECLLTAVGKLWQLGVTPDWKAALDVQNPRKMPLPTYPFQRKRYWIPPGRAVGPGSSALDVPGGTDTLGSAPALSAVDPVILGDATTEADAATPRQNGIAAVWEELLGISNIGLDDNFEALGGHSLLAAQMLPQLRCLCAASLKITDLFGAPTVRQLAALMDMRESGQSTEVDLAAEVALDPAVRAAGTQPATVGFPVDGVFLTGATGFLGTYLMSELLQTTKATVYCLVRAKDAADGEKRLRASLEGFGLPLPQEGRLVAVPGDLEKPRLGVPGAMFEFLAKNTGAIYHCGAWVNFARPYMVLKRANVGGTEEVFRLATRHRLKMVHYISTIFVTMGSITTGVPFIAEDDALPPPVGHDTAYTESKWVGEGLCKLAHERGIPVAIYRPGNIFGDHVRGVVNREDYFTRLVQGCVKLGLAPQRRFDLPIGTVDDVAKTIVALSGRTDAAGRTYHVVHPQPMLWDTIFENVRQFGFNVPSVPWDEWRSALADHLSTGGTDNVLAPLADMIGNVPSNRSMPRFGIDRVAEVRKEAESPYPELGVEYFSTVLTHMVRTGLLPSPDKAHMQAAK
jgi:phthiocerol/phenolphthiocerol synthesis type-I polyketide synthase E